MQKVGHTIDEAKAKSTNIENLLLSIIPISRHALDIAIIRLNLVECKSQITIDSLVLNQKNFDTKNVQIILEEIDITINNINKYKLFKLEKIENKSTLAPVKIKKSGIKNQYQKPSNLFQRSEACVVIWVITSHAINAHKIAWNQSFQEIAVSIKITAKENLTSISNRIFLDTKDEIKWLNFILLIK